MKWLYLTSGIILLLGVLNLPYEYYVFLRWAICILAIIASYTFYNSNNTGHSIIFGAVALLFNPLFPIYLTKSTWIVLDIVGATIFFYATYINKNYENEKRI